MFEPKLYYAQVIDNDDQNHDDGNKKGRVQVRVLPEMQGIKPEYLPWVEPFFNVGLTETNISYNPPPVDAKIWVLFVDNYWKNGYYLTGAFISGLFDVSVATDKVNDISEDLDITYPDFKFQLLQDGTLLFYNSETISKGMINPNGWYFIINADGQTHWYFKDQELKIWNDETEIYIQDDGKIDLTTSGDISLNTDGKITAVGGNDIQIKNGGVTFDLKEDGTYKIDGNGSIECTSTGQLKINGSNLTVD